MSQKGGGDHPLDAYNLRDNAFSTFQIFIYDKQSFQSMFWFWFKTHMFDIYDWFHIIGTWSVHSFNGDYLSIHKCTCSCGNLFHELPSMFLKAWSQDQTKLATETTSGEGSRKKIVWKTHIICKSEKALSLRL